MDDEKTEAAAPSAEPQAAAPSPKPEADRSKSSFRSSPAAASTVDSRLNGGAGVQRSHLRDRKTWLKKRVRAGQTWSQRKNASLTYCPAKARAS
jgi:hypothetical protein